MASCHDQLKADGSRGAGKPLSRAVGILCRALWQWRARPLAGGRWVERTIALADERVVDQRTSRCPSGLNGGARCLCESGIDRDGVEHSCLVRQLFRRARPSACSPQGEVAWEVER